MADMKEVQYNGILSFRIPERWVEETEPDGFGVYYLPASDSGTLRVNLMTLRKPGGGNRSDYAIALGKARCPGRVEILPNGHLLRIDSMSDQEDGVTLRLRCWQLARIYPPDSVRLATFTHTLEAASASGAAAQEELRMIDAEVRNATFIDLSPDEVRKAMD